MRSARTLSVTPYGVPAPPKGGAFLCGGKVCLSGSYPFRLLPLVAATLPLLSLRDIFPRPGEVGPQGDGNPLSHRYAMPAPPKGELFETAAKFFVALDALALRATACALSVKAYGFASSPKGRAKSTAGSVLIAPKTLVMNFTAWLSLRESWRGSA